MQGLHEAFLEKGYAEVEARKLVKLADYREAYALHPAEFEEGYLAEMERKGRRRLTREKLKTLLPWILGGGALGVALLTPWGHRRLEDIFGNEQSLRELNARQVRPFQFDRNAVKE